MTGRAINFTCYNVETVGAWSTAANMNAIYQQSSGAGTQTAALNFGGRCTGSPNVTGQTESYNGTICTELPDMNNAGTIM